MSRKSKYPSPSVPRSHNAASAHSKPLRSSEDDWKRGEDSEISAPLEARPMVQELWALLSEVRTATFFVETEERRLPVVERISQIHRTLLRSRAIKGYVGGTESRQAKRLLESYGSRFRVSATEA